MPNAARGRFRYSWSVNAALPYLYHSAATLICAKTSNDEAACLTRGGPCGSCPRHAEADPINAECAAQVTFHQLHSGGQPDLFFQLNCVCFFDCCSFIEHDRTAPARPHARSNVLPSVSNDQCTVVVRTTRYVDNMCTWRVFENAHAQCGASKCVAMAGPVSLRP